MSASMLTAICLVGLGTFWIVTFMRRLTELERHVQSLLSHVRRLDDEVASILGRQTLESGTIRTRRLEVVDDEGLPVARLSLSADGPSLDLLDRSRHVRASLWVEEKGPAFILYDKEGNAIHTAP